MKHIYSKMRVLAIAVFLCSNFIASGQEAPADDGPQFVTITTNHWNMEYDGDEPLKEWTNHYTELSEKVIKKNERLMAHHVLRHVLSSDNSEVLFVNVYKNWEDIDKAPDRGDELFNEAWPDSLARVAWGKKNANFYSGKHSDEIYATTPLTKPYTPGPDEETFLVFQNVGIDWPDDGSGKEIMAMEKEFVENVVYKNSYIKGYYPLMHAWGADNTVMLKVYEVSTFGDIDKMWDAYGDLVKAHWPDEAKRKAFFDRYDLYYSGTHSDAVYSPINGVGKNMGN